jgi:hypothetical protein
MKLVFALIVLVNNLPNNTDGMYFVNASDCNQMAFETETGYAGSGPDGTSKSWKSNGVNIRAYCEPRMVEKNARAF